MMIPSYSEWPDGYKEESKIPVNGKYVKVNLEKFGNRLLVEPDNYTPREYKDALNNELKAFKGRKYHGFEKDNYNGLKRQAWAWSFPLLERNIFQWLNLMGENPYELWDRELISLDNLDPRISIARGWDHDAYDHQLEMAMFAYTHRHCMFGAEPGTGKTLAMILTLERLNKDYHLGQDDIWYVGPKSALKSVEMEMVKWECALPIRSMTYQGMAKTMDEWEEGVSAPRCVIFDECQQIKSEDAWRSRSAMGLANGVREDHGYESLILGMTGTPAPANPIDWHHPCEVLSPGFLKEGSPNQFKRRLEFSVLRENLQYGGKYPHHITWWDDTEKCAVCGQYEDASRNDKGAPHDRSHMFKPSINEVEGLFDRLEGLVLIKLKKDCLDLPEIQYRVIRVRPTKDMMLAYKAIKDNSDQVITALTSWRTLSDGFEYYREQSGPLIPCSTCEGNGKYDKQIPIKGASGQLEDVEEYETHKDFECETCSGTGEVKSIIRKTRDIETPKIEAVKELMRQYSDIGRMVVWGGFKATIKKLVNVARSEGWAVLKIDGSGWAGLDAMGDPLNTDELLMAMDGSHKRYNELRDKYPKLMVIAHPEAGGTGLTFTASPVAVYFSNTFKSNDRVQSEQRIHRAGMDTNRGCVIYDLVCLPSDIIVYNNLKDKRNLERMSMGVLQDELNNESYNNEETS